MKEDGYDVKKIHSEKAFSLYSNHTHYEAQKHLTLGYAGNGFIWSQVWTKVVESFMPANCEMAFSQKMK